MLVRLVSFDICNKANAAGIVFEPSVRELNIEPNYKGEQ